MKRTLGRIWGLYVGAFLGAVWGLTACNFERNVEIPMPAYTPKLAVECYLEDGVEPRLYLSETRPFFSDLDIPSVDEADVFLTHPDGTIDTLRFDPLLDIDYTKLYNFRKPGRLQLREGETYSLSIRDKKGREIKGRTTVLPHVILDTLYSTYRDRDSAANLIAFLRDTDPTRSNYFRVIVHKGTDRATPEFEYAANDDFANDGKIPLLFSNYRWERGDTITFRVYHIDQAYYNFLESIDAAERGSGNPFAQPAVVRSTVNPGFGVFTSLRETRRTLIVP